MKQAADTWNSGDPYEYFMGRWSQLMAPVFLKWLNFPGHRSWIDIGCGTGALSEAVYKHAHPQDLYGVDPSPEFIKKAKERLEGKGNFLTGTASAIPYPDHVFDIAVSGLALNFFPDLPSALAEIKRVLKDNGSFAAYVWDYSGRMDLLRIFWNVACGLDTGAQQLDEGIRFPICDPHQLKDAFQKAGFVAVETTYLDIPTIFSSFNDYWDPFLGGQGPAPGYLASLNGSLQQELKNAVQRALPVEADGSIRLLGRAIAVKGSLS